MWYKTRTSFLLGFLSLAIVNDPAVTIYTYTHTLIKLEPLDYDQHAS